MGELGYGVKRTIEGVVEPGNTEFKLFCSRGAAVVVPIWGTGYS
jgi:hypothetical protein